MSAVAAGALDARAAGAADGDPDALDALAWACRWRGDGDGAVRARTRAFRLHRCAARPVRAAGTAIWIAADQLELRGAPVVAGGWLERARRLLAGRGDRLERAWLAIVEGTAAMPADPRLARRHGRAAAALGRRFDDADAELTGRALEGRALVALGDAPAGLRRLDEAAAAALGGEFDGFPAVVRTCTLVLDACEALADHDREAAWWREIAAHPGLVAALGRGAPADPGRPLGAAAPARGLLRHDGDYWTVGYAGTVVRLRDSKGMRHLATLVGAPGREFHVLELAAGAPERVAGPGDAALAAGRTGEDPVLDAEAKAAYRRRLGDLEHELAEANAFNDPERAARARAERESLAEHLAAAVGFGGRDRRLASAAERARWSVGKALRAAHRRLAAELPALGHHLDATLRTGTFCAYVPERGVPVAWDLGGPGGTREVPPSW